MDLNTLEFRFVSAGHDPVVHVPRHGAPLMVEGGNMAIGWTDDLEYDECVVNLERGDRLYLYSDGVPEATDADDRMFGMERFERVILDHRDAPAAQIAVSVVQAVDEFAGSEEPFDDIAVVVIKRS